MSPDESHKTKTKPQVLDWEDLRTKSLQRGGFGEERVEIWPRLLHVKEKHAPSADEKSSFDELPSHKDERQIGLDTDRSFVLYPVEPKIDREALQADLHKLLVSLFRKRPRLNYFQGYHDIVTVFFLTLPPELRLACVEKLSLHRLRDSMGLGLEPVLGLLRVTKNLLRLADPEFAEVLERNSPLPFYALSNLLTLFSHDVPTLPLIQHVFDFLLCRPPIATVYLAAAMILSRKKEVLRLEEEEEDGMIHSLLSSFPNLVDDIQDLEQGGDAPSFSKSEDSIDGDGTFFKDERDAEILESIPSSTILSAPTHQSGLSLMANREDGYTPDDPFSDILEKMPGLPPEPSEETGPTDTEPPDFLHPVDVPASSSSSTRSAKPPSSSNGQDRLSGSLSSSLVLPENSAISQENAQAETITVSLVNDAVKSEAPDATPVPTSSESPLSTVPLPVVTDETISSPRSPTAPSYLILTNLLRHADELYKQFPPSHSGLSLSSIMGPQSVVFTWSESAAGLPSDSMAEAMVGRPELVVYPYVEEKEKAEEEGSVSSSEEDDERKGEKKGKEKAKSRRPWKRRDSKSKPKRKRRKLRKSPFGQVEKRAMVAGTVLVLGVAMAVYGIKSRNSGGAIPYFGVHEGRAAVAAGGSSSGSARELRKLGGWVSGALVGMSAKIMNGLASSSSAAGRPS